MDADNLTQNENYLDRRDFNRIKTKGKVLLKCMTPPFEIVNAEIIDASANGMNILTRQSLDMNMPVQISVLINRRALMPQFGGNIVDPRFACSRKGQHIENMAVLLVTVTNGIVNDRI